MPFVNVKLVEGVFNEEEKHQMAAALTEVMVRCLKVPRRFGKWLVLCSRAADPRCRDQPSIVNTSLPFTLPFALRS